MTYSIGIDRPIYPEWMDYSASLFLKGMSFTKAKEKMEKYLQKSNVNSLVTRRKSKSIVLNVWFKPKNELELQQIKNKLQNMNQQEKNELYFQLLQKQYPFFEDICKIISRLEKVSDVVKTADISRRVFEIWGETPSIKSSLTKAIRTYRLFKAVLKVGNIAT
jgi:ribosomal protein S24E